MKKSKFQLQTQVSSTLAPRTATLDCTSHINEALKGTIGDNLSLSALEQAEILIRDRFSSRLLTRIV